MARDALIQSWLDLPFNIDIFLSNNPNYTIGYFMENFSGLRELIERPDAGSMILQRYRYMHPNCVSANSFDEGGYTLSYPIIELPISQNAILNKLSITEKKSLVVEALMKYEAKKRHQESFGGPNGAYSLLVCLKTMVNAGYEPFLNELENTESDYMIAFYNTGNLLTSSYDSSEASTILEYSRHFIR